MRYPGEPPEYERPADYLRPKPPAAPLEAEGLEALVAKWRKAFIVTAPDGSVQPSADTCADELEAALRHSRPSAPDYAPVAKKLSEYMKAISNGAVNVHPNQIELFLEREMPAGTPSAGEPPALDLQNFEAWFTKWCVTDEADFLDSLDIHMRAQLAGGLKQAWEAARASRGAEGDVRRLALLEAAEIARPVDESLSDVIRQRAASPAVRGSEGDKP